MLLVFYWVYFKFLDILGSHFPQNGEINPIKRTCKKVLIFHGTGLAAITGGDRGKITEINLLATEEGSGKAYGWKKIMGGGKTAPSGCRRTELCERGQREISGR